MTDTRIVYAKGLLGKAKTLVALAIPAAQVIQAAITDNEITSNEWTKIAIAVVGAIGVYFAPNRGVNALARTVQPIEPGPLDEGYIDGGDA